MAKALPSITQQKKFIIENSHMLNHESKLTILSIVLMEIGSSVVMEPSSRKEVDIDLDSISSINEDVITHIYNIVAARRDVLCQPAMI